MKRAVLRMILLVVCALHCPSCAATPNIRDRMLQASKQCDSNFPDGAQRKLTKFAYIGDVTSQGGTLRVVEARSIITGMLAPRGQMWLAFYDHRGHFIGDHIIDAESPALWCEGSRVYFYGLQTDGVQQGNALDLEGGFFHRRYMLVPEEGSWMPNDK